MCHTQARSLLDAIRRSRRRCVQRMATMLPAAVTATPEQESRGGEIVSVSAGATLPQPRDRENIDT